MATPSNELKSKMITGAAFMEIVELQKSQNEIFAKAIREDRATQKGLVESSKELKQQVQDNIASNNTKLKSQDDKIEVIESTISEVNTKVDVLKDVVKNLKESTGVSIEDLKSKVAALGDLRTEVNSLLSNAKQELNKRVDDELGNLKNNVIPEALSELKRKSESDIRKAQNEIGNAVDAAKSDVYNHYNELRRDLWQKVTTQDTKIDSFEGKLEDITKEISKNSSKDSEIKTKVSVIENTVQSLRQDLWEKVSSQDDKFTSTNNRLNEIENKAVENSNKDSELRGKLEVYENQLNVLRTENITLQGKNEELTNKLAVLGGKMLQVIDNLNELKGKVEAGADNKLSKSDIKEIFEEIYG